MLRILIAIILFAGGVTAGSAKSLVAEIDLSSQTLTVVYKGEALATWQVSTGRAGYRTPKGSFRPQRMYREYFSRQYDGAPMPNAIFYDRGYAIHGSYELSSLGRPASHGCVRLAPGNAEKLFEMVLAVGAENTAIRVKR
ncbi:MAG: L,D-transpeptidase [Pseudomonadota bacterium]